jgi:hypothetical protein
MLVACALLANTVKAKLKAIALALRNFIDLNTVRSLLGWRRPLAAGGACEAIILMLRNGYDVAMTARVDDNTMTSARSDHPVAVKVRRDKDAVNIQQRLASASKCLPDYQ